MIGREISRCVSGVMMTVLVVRGEFRHFGYFYVMVEAIFDDFIENYGIYVCDVLEK